MLASLRGAMPSMRVLQWNVDPLFEPDNVARLRAKFGVVDATLVSTAGEALAALRHPGMRLGFLPNPVDFSIETGEAHLHPHLPHDLFFACGHPTRPRRVLCGQAWDMEDLFAEIARILPGLRLKLAGLAGQPPIFGHAYQHALGQTAMGLNVSRRNDVPLYSSDRLAQIAGNGLAVLIDRATGYDRLFTHHEMAFFASFDELAAQLRRLAADPAARCALAAAGRARYHALFNETLIARYLVDMACGTHDPKDVEWPSLVG
jgi:hypothetical protein